MAIQIISKIPSSAITYIWMHLEYTNQEIYNQENLTHSDISSPKHQDNFIVHVTTMQGEKKKKEKTTTPYPF